MSKENKRFYEFGPFRIDSVNRQLFRSGEIVPLKAKAVETLLLLIENRGNVVEKDDLMKLLWPDSFVEEANLTQNIYTLRKALGETQYIETVPRRGYRFAAQVTEWEDGNQDFIVIKEETSARLTYEEEFVGVTSKSDYHESPFIETVPVATPTATATEGRSHPSSRQKRWIVSAGVLVLLALAGLVFMPGGATPRFQQLRLTRLTTSGKAELATISADGKYLAYVVRDSGQQSVWLKQIATGKDIQVIGPAAVQIYGLTFSHDGGYLYYVSLEMNHFGMLYQVPSLGGRSIKLAEDVDSGVTLSPDDKRLAFIRMNPAERGVVLLNVDGSAEHKLATTAATATTRIEPSFLVPPAWSPDGKVIACPVGISTKEDEYQTVWGYDAEKGTGSELTSSHWQALGWMEWLSDNSGLIIAAADDSQIFYQQVWFLPYRGGAARKVTNDLNDYRNLSVTSDSKTIVALQAERRANIWVAPANDLTQKRQVTSTNYDGLDGLTWTADGKLLYTQQSGGEQNIWATDLNGSAWQLTKHAGFHLHPVNSNDGHYLVFVSTRSGRLHLWRTDAEGRAPFELTHGLLDRDPTFTPDGKAVIYQSYVPGAGNNLFRVAIEGGEPTRLVDKISADPIVSPDGKWLAFIYRESPAAINQLALMPVMGGELKFISKLPAHYGRFRWTPDSAGIAYAASQERVGNIWVQPIDGGPVKQLSHWDPNPILSFGWSNDGKWLAYSDAVLSSDVVMIHDESPESRLASLRAWLRR